MTVAPSTSSAGLSRKRSVVLIIVAHALGGVCVSDTIEKPAESNETAAPADKPSPVETMVPEGLLKLSGSDAMGPNPWTREKPVASDFGLTDADFADGKVEK